MHLLNLCDRQLLVNCDKAIMCTVELPNNGHLGSRPFVLYMEVVPL